MISSVAANLRISAIIGAVSVVLLTGASSAAPTANEALDVLVDRATVVKAPENTSTVIVGNPLIADATSQRNGVLIVTGKSFGSTNLMLLDAKGDVLSETLVNVRRAQDGTVVVQRGAKRESLSCNPRCEPVLSIGDSNDSFSNTAGQITTRNGMSTGKTD